jgi:hypothetical protein
MVGRRGGMLTPEKESIISNFRIEYEKGNLEKASSIRIKYENLITAQDIIEWEQLHDCSLFGW